MRYLESERLLLKPIEEEEIYQLLELRWDRDVMRFALHEPISKEEQRAWYRSLTKRDLALSVFFKGEDKKALIGTIGLFNIDMRHQRASIRIRLSQEYHGQGIGSEAVGMLLDYAFNTLNLQRVDSLQFRENIALVKIATRFGFKKEGLLRRYFYHDGRFKDASFFGLLKEDFFAARDRYHKKKRSKKADSE